MTRTVRMWGWCLAASCLLSGCASTGTETAVRGRSVAPHGIADESEAENRTLLERIAFWDRMGIPALEAAPPAESFTLRPDGLQAEAAPPPGTYKSLLASAHEMYRQGKPAEAGRLFKYLADRERVPPQIGEEARYHEAECYRVQGYYPSAADTYTALLNKFPSTLYREQAVRHIYDIADYWIDDTRARMDEMKEYNEGKRWWVNPRFFSFDKSKPLLDREGNALKALETVRLNDINGPLADKALFACGSVSFFNGNYREADYYFTQIHERHPNSEHAARALQLAIIAKHMGTGGPDYDGRKAAEARKLIDAAMANYPELAAQREDMEKQRAYITYQQAEKDYRQADFYERKGKLGAAYFYYNLVKNTYKGTPHAEKAAARAEAIRGQVEAQNGNLGETPTPAPGQTPAPVITPGPGAAPELAPAPQRGS